jgi:hypothetical protein
MSNFRNQTVSACCAFLCAIVVASAADYSAWSHSGSLFIITTPEGANLPASASEANFPLLVRLNSSNFNFAQAKADGSDLRFAIQGGGTATNPATELSYEIEQWDTANGAAAIWVKIPTITGNARQEIRMYWGNAAATSASNGKAVFSDNFATVFHMNQAGLVQDSTGSITTKISDSGSTQSNGIIGKARHFTPEKNITCSDVAVLPVGNNPHTTQFWVRAEAGNSAVMGWGKEASQAKVDLSIMSPTRVGIDNYFGPLSLAGATPLALSQWVHVVCTWNGTTGKLYVNGALDGENSGSSTKMPNPATLFMGRTHNTNASHGDVDEVRISKAARSANWVKLEFENQKALQTLVGPLVRSGSAFSVTPASMTINEGATATFTGQADGAQKLYWSRIDNGVETLLAVDQFSYTFTAERVTANLPYTLRFKAVYPTEVTDNSKIE